MKTKEQKRREAAERDSLRAKRTPEEQLAHLDMCGFTATKERARLLKQIENAKA